MERQFPRRYDFVSVKIGQRHLSRGHKPEVVLFIMIQVIGELGQTGSGSHTLPPDHKRWVYFSITVLGGVEVEHKGNESSLQSGAQPFEHIKARA
ncbi:hypothetical protein ES708_19773 [subsurface metagenome]